MSTTHTGSQLIHRSHKFLCDTCDGPANVVTLQTGDTALECCSPACGWAWLMFDPTGDPYPTFQVLALRDGRPILRRG